MTTTHQIKTTMGGYEWSLLLSLSLIWGSAFPLNNIALNELPPLSLVTIRLIIAALTLHLVVILLGRRVHWNTSSIGAFLTMGLFANAIPFSLISWAQLHIAGGLAAILNATAPFFAIIAAHYWTTDEKISPRKLFGLLLGFIGVVFVIGPELLQELGVDLWAQLAVVVAAICYTIAIIFARRLSYHPLVVAAGQMTMASIALLPFTVIIDAPWQFTLPSWNIWMIVLMLGLLPTALAFVVYFHLLARAGATNLMLVAFLIPVNAIMIGAVFLDEQLAIMHFIGMFFLGCGLMVIDGRIFGKQAR